MGVKFGYNLNAYTSVDETVYNISNVPTARESVQDSCLLILHDWANDLLLDPEEIDKERGVIHEEWRRSNVGQMRIIEQLLPTVYPDNRYGYRLPIGTMEVVDNFDPQVLRDYYHKLATSTRPASRLKSRSSSAPSRCPRTLPSASTST